MDELLRILRENGKETPENLAGMLGVSAEEVTTRIADYESRGVIRGYQAIINDAELDVDQVRAVIEVRVTPEREGGFDRIANRVAQFPEVTSLYLMSGGHDLLVFVSGSTLHAVAGFVSERLATIDGVTGTSTHFMLKPYKEHGVLMNVPESHERLKISP